MTSTKVMIMALDLMGQHGLIRNGWTFHIDRAKNRCGCCFYFKKRISLSRFYIHDPCVPDHDIRNTILHEIAHALVGYAAGHGPVWVAKAKSIGCDGKRCNTVWGGVPAKYNITCHCGRICKWRHRVHKYYKNVACSHCKTLQVVRI